MSAACFAVYFNFRGVVSVMEENLKEEGFSSRTELLIGCEGIDRLASSSVAVFGIGGVGGYAVEALARCGIGSFLLVDHDIVALSNINRQIIATHRTIGMPKVEVMKERILDINPEARVDIRDDFYLPENAASFDLRGFSYVVDAMDTVTAKLELITQARSCGVPVISSMGAGNKLNPSLFRVSDIYDTCVCPLARVIRRECRKRGIEHLKVVYSTETPVRPPQTADGKRPATGSISFVPSAAGLMLAGEVVKDLLNCEN